MSKSIQAFLSLLLVFTALFIGDVGFTEELSCGRFFSASPRKIQAKGVAKRILGGLVSQVSAPRGWSSAGVIPGSEKKMNFSLRDNMYHFKDKKGLVEGDVTTSEHYSTEVILEHLNLSQRSFAKERVLSVGEGASELVRSLNNSGYDAKGLDIWYNEKLDNAPELKRFILENQRDLIKGSAEKIPLKNESVDTVVSHQSYAYFRNRDKALSEMLRITRRGGRVKIFYGCGSGGCDPVAIREIKDSMEDYGYHVEVHRKESTLNFHGRSIKVFGFLVDIVKDELAPTSRSLF